MTADDLPDWAVKGRPVEPEWRKRRNAKRARRFVMIGWAELAPALCALGTDKATRLLLVLHLHERLQRARTNDGWIDLLLHDLKATELADGHLNRAVAKLERFGRVEVRRRSGKRPLLRLVKANGGGMAR
jgi:hypothetical protein